MLTPIAPSDNSTSLALGPPSSRDSTVIHDEAGVEDLAGSGDMIAEDKDKHHEAADVLYNSKDVASKMRYLQRR